MTDNLPDIPAEKGGVPPEIKKKVIEKGSAALEGLVEPQHRAEVVDRVLRSLEVGVAIQQTEITATQHVGPVPAPETVGEYERVLPGSADRMFTMAETDQKAYIASNRRDQYLDFIFNISSLVMGAAGLIAILAAAIYLAEHDRENVAIALVGLGISGVIGAFVNARWKKSKD